MLSYEEKLQSRWLMYYTLYLVSDRTLELPLAIEIIDKSKVFPGFSPKLPKF